MTKKVLIISNENDITADFIVKKLRDANAEFYRLNTNQLGNSIQLCIDISKQEFTIFDQVLNKTIDLSEVKSVYYRRPELTVNPEGLSEGEVNFIYNELYFTLEGLYKILDNAFWLNKVQAIRNAENKIYQLLEARKIGFEVPHSVTTNNQNAALNFYGNYNEWIVQPIQPGFLLALTTEEGVLFTSKIILNEENINRIGSCPIYLQNLIEKKGDVRVTVIGNKLFSAFIHSQECEDSKTDWRQATHPLGHSSIELPPEIQSKCLELVRRLSLNFAAIDFILDQNGHFVFLEINPNGQWAWIEKRLNYSISDEITNLLLEKAY